MQFQILDWRDDIKPEDYSSGDTPDYKIHLFGRTIRGDSVCCIVNGFKPYFYIRIPPKWTDDDIMNIMFSIKGKPEDKIREELKALGYIGSEEYKKYMKMNKEISGLIVPENIRENIIKMCTLYYFNAYKKLRFLKLEFRNYKDYQEGRTRLKQYFYNNDRELFIKKQKGFKKFQFYEDNISPLLKFMHERDLDASGWVNIPKFKQLKYSDYLCHEVISCYYEGIHKYETDNIAPFNILSFDIECIGGHTEGDDHFPLAENPDDVINQIGLTYNYLGEKECHYKAIITLDTCSPIDGVEIFSCETERELLLKWSDLIRDTDPDIITGYNINGFDYKYIHDRAELLGVNLEVSDLSRCSWINCNFIKKKLSSSGMGDNILYYYDIPGRVTIDLFKVIQTGGYNYESNTLDFVSSMNIRDKVKKIILDEGTSKIYTKDVYGIEVEQYLTISYNNGIIDDSYEFGRKFKILDIVDNQEETYIRVAGEIDINQIQSGSKIFWCQAKDEMKYRDLFRMQFEGPDERRTIARYCVQDCELCNKLMNKLQIVLNNIGMSNVCSVPFSYLFLRGQGIKIYSLAVKECNKMGFLIPNRTERNDEETIGKINKKNMEYQLVLEVEKDGLVDYVLKYSSNKINAVVNHYSSLTDEYKVPNLISKNCRETDCYPIRINPDLTIFMHQVSYKHNGFNITSYVTSHNDTKIKRIKISEKNPHRSFYFLETNSDSGDILKINHENCKYTILVDVDYKYKTKQESKEDDDDDEEDNEEYLETSNIQGIWHSFVCNDSSFLEDADVKPDVKVLYNKKSPEKGRLKEREGYEGAIVLKPTKGFHDSPVFVKDYASLYPSSMIQRNISHECFVKIGGIYDNLPDYYYTDVCFTDSDGRKIICRYAKAKNGRMGVMPKILQNLLLQRKRVKKLVKTALKEGNVFLGAVYDALQLAYKVTANSLYGQTGSSVSQIYFKEIAASTTATGRDMLMYGRDITENIFVDVVRRILNDDESYRELMLRIYDRQLFESPISTDAIRKLPVDLIQQYQFRFDDIESLKKIILRDISDDQELMKIYDCYVYQNLNFDGFMRYYIDYYEPSIECSLTMMLLKNNYLNKLRDDIKSLMTGYSMTLDTVYGDTDSIFVKPFIRDMTGELQKDHNSLIMSIRLGILSGIFINKLMPNPHDLEYEKTFYPFILLTKKRYTGYLFEDDPEVFKLKSMGIVLKRRDNAPIVKIVCGGIVKRILDERSVDRALDFTKIALEELLNGEYPMDKFIVSKKLKAYYKNRSSISHVVLADRIAERDPGNKPEVNDRVPYIFIRKKESEVTVQGDRAESPGYIVENNLKIDYLYYIQKQIMKPAIQFLDTLTDKGSKIFDSVIRQEENRRNGQKRIDSFFKVMSK